jgi:hypothetical protein
MSAVAPGTVRIIWEQQRYMHEASLVPDTTSRYQVLGTRWYVQHLEICTFLCVPVLYMYSVCTVHI